MEKKKWVDIAAKEAASIDKTHKFIPTDCQFITCPEHKTCPKTGSLLRAFGKPTVKVLFLFEAPNQDEVKHRRPTLGPGGRIFREQFLSPLLAAAGMFPYYVTTTLRNSLRNEDSTDREASTKEYRTCWVHLRKEIERLQPETIVTFGAGAFNQLVSHADNHEDLDGLGEGEDTITKLRGKFYSLVFGGRTVQVFPTYGTGYIAKNPTALTLLLDDREQFQSYLKTGNSSTRQVEEVKIEHVSLLKTHKEVFEFFDFLQFELPEHSCVSFDTELPNLNHCYNNKFLTWQFGWAPGVAAVVPLEHPDMPLFADPEAKKALIVRANEFFNATPATTNIDWIIAHNAKFDLAVMHGLLGVLPREQGCIPWWCTMLAMHWLDENRKHRAALLDGKPYSLKTLAKEFFGFKFRNDILAARADGDLVELDFADLVDYGGDDAILTYALKVKQQQLAQLQPGDALPILERFMSNYYWPASRTVAVMECNGLYVQREHIEYLQGSFSPIWTRMDEIEKVELQNRPEVLDFRKQYRDVVSGVKSKIQYEDDLWGEDVSDDYLPPINLNKKEQQQAFYLDFLKLQPLKYSEATKDASLDKKFLEHHAVNYLNGDRITNTPHYLEFYKKDEDGNSPSNPVQLDIEYRQLKRLGTAYTNSMQEYLDDPVGDCIDGKVRASFLLSGTDTGRLASREPNFQNLPAGRTKAAKEIKNMFQAEPPSDEYPNGTYLIQVDYTNAEVIWAGIMSEEPRFTDGIKESNELIERAYVSDILSDKEFEEIILSSDFHKRTASLMYNVRPEDVTKPMRQAAKAITFGILFGKSIASLAKEQGWTEEEGHEKFRKFFSAFPKLEKWLNHQKLVARKYGYVETLMGRRRRLGSMYAAGDSRNSGDADRRAMNSPIQGQSSDAGMCGMFSFFHYILRHGLEKRWKILNMVHDSILVQVPAEDIRDVLPILKMYLTSGMKRYIEKHWGLEIPVTLRVDFDVGVRYGDLKNWDSRNKTLDGVLAEVEKKANELWYPKVKEQEPQKPASILDLVRYAPVG